MNALVVARFTSYLFLLAAAGLPFYGTIRRRPPYDPARRIVLLCIAVIAIVASAAWAIVNVAAMAGVELHELDTETVFMVLRATPLGNVVQTRLAFLVLFCAALAWRPTPWLLSVFALLALATSAWAGHAGAGEGSSGTLLHASDVIHLFAAALWLGALLSFTTRLFCGLEPAQVICDLAEFADAGTIVVAALIGSGLVNAWLIADPSKDGLGTLSYGSWLSLIGAKILFFGAMLGFAALNRWRLVPSVVAGSPSAVTMLKWSLALETACAITVIIIVAYAGQLSPSGA